MEAIFISIGSCYFIIIIIINIICLFLVDLVSCGDGHKFFFFYLVFVPCLMSHFKAYSSCSNTIQSRRRVDQGNSDEEVSARSMLNQS